MQVNILICSCTTCKVPGAWDGWRRRVGAHPVYVVGWGSRSGGRIFCWLATLLTSSLVPVPAFHPFHQICLICAYLSLLLAQNKSWLATLHSKLVSFYPGPCYLLCLVGWTLHQHLLLNLLSPLSSQLINMPRSIFKHAEAAHEKSSLPCISFLLLP